MLWWKYGICILENELPQQIKDKLEQVWKASLFELKWKESKERINRNFHILVSFWYFWWKPLGMSQRRKRTEPSWLEILYSKWWQFRHSRKASISVSWVLVMRTILILVLVCRKVKVVCVCVCRERENEVVGERVLSFF